jgi:TatD DNase family protein
MDIMLIDTHCHIHSVDYPLDSEETLARASAAGVTKIICVDTGAEDERAAREFAAAHPDRVFYRGPEVGLDYYYPEPSPKIQRRDLVSYLDKNGGEPVIFHVREAFADFFKVISGYPNVRGVIHSFSGTEEDLWAALKYDLYFGISGLAIFRGTAVYKEIPMDRILLETDAPYLTPPPFRGKVNEPAYVKNIAEWVATQKGVTLEEVAAATTANATKLFNI